jgi:hypothetical protein
MRGPLPLLHNRHGLQVDGSSERRAIFVQRVWTRNEALSAELRLHLQQMHTVQHISSIIASPGTQLTLCRKTGQQE